MQAESWQELDEIERIETLPAWDMTLFLAGLEKMEVLSAIPADDVCAIAPFERFSIHREVILAASLNTEDEDVRKYFRTWGLRATLLLRKASPPTSTEDLEEYPTTYHNIGEIAQMAAAIAGKTPQELWGQ